MGKTKNVGKSVGFFPIVIVDRYPMEWAMTPQEVPPWDPSRGFPLRSPRWNEKPPENEPSEESFLELYGNESWTPLPPPEIGYPRLIRKWKPVPAEKWLLGLDSENIVNVVSRIAWHLPKLGPPHKQQMPNKHAMNHVLKVAGKYGPAISPEQNTFADWVTLAAEAIAHLDVLRALHDPDMSYGEVQGYVEERAAEHWDRPEFATIEENWSRRADADDWFSDWDRMLYRAKRSESPKEFRKENVSFLMQLVAGRELRVVLIDDHLGALVSTRDALRLHLAELWRDNARPKTCTVCGLPFIPTRANRKTCSNRCRGAKYDKKKRNLRGARSRRTG